MAPEASAAFTGLSGRSGTARTAADAPSAPSGMSGEAADSIRRSELAAFLRSRRERITPEQVGLPRGARRRTPGLRREEVAQLAAVGVTWYTWMEQARDIQASVQVLDSVARALMLDRGERSHLFALANVADPMPDTACTGVPEALLQMLEQLEPFPACVQNSRYDILAYNRSYGQLLCDLDALPAADRNCLWLTFTNAEWRARIVQREETIRLMTARFRAAMAEHVAEPAWKCLVKRLHEASPEFREIWARHEVVNDVGNRTKAFQHPEIGLIRVCHSSLWLGPNPGSRLSTYTPVDEESRERLERLHRLALSRRPAAASAG